MKRWLLVPAFTCFLCFIACGQSVVVSGYFNAADPRDEWTELLVITDNTDMRGWSIRDDNSSQTSWQTAATFTNNALWNHLRAGTIILIWHRPVESDGSTAHPTDVNKDDGYIEVDLSNATYFSGAALGSSPSWGGNTMNIAGSGDVIQLRDASSNHVHALGHKSSPGSDFTALPSPKLNHANSASSGDAIYVCPGDLIADYGTTSPQNGTTWTSKNSSTITFGLPNISGSAATANTAFWDTLREPAFASQTVVPVAVAGSPGSISFSWTAATDPNSADATTGYIILRNTTNTFTPPADGTTYVNGATIGSATVLTHISSSSTTTYTDNTVMNGNSYFYRVYAYRYTTDNQNGNTYHRSRGRAYTSTFVDVQQANPLPVELLSFTGQKKETTALLQWQTASELNNHYFEIERAGENGLFESIGLVNGFGTTTQVHSYTWPDENPLEGNNYYRLRQTDFNGQFSISPVICLRFEKQNSANVLAWSYDNTISYSLSGWNAPVTIQLYDLSGQLVAEEQREEDGAGSISLAEYPHGIYLLRFSSGTHEELRKIYH